LLELEWNDAITETKLAVLIRSDDAIYAKLYRRAVQSENASLLNKAPDCSALSIEKGTT